MGDSESMFSHRRARWSFDKSELIRLQIAELVDGWLGISEPLAGSREWCIVDKIDVVDAEIPVVDGKIRPVDGQEPFLEGHRNEGNRRRWSL